MRFTSLNWTKMVARRSLLLSVVAAAGIGVLKAQDPHGDVFVGGPKYKKDRTPTARQLKGTVTDETGKPLAGALVTLTNLVKNEKLTFITKGDGRYHFDEIPFHVDCEVSAQYQDMKSPVKKLSQYDNTPEIVRILEVAPKKAQDSN